MKNKASKAKGQLHLQIWIWIGEEWGKERERGEKGEKGIEINVGIEKEISLQLS